MGIYSVRVGEMSYSIMSALTIPLLRQGMKEVVSIYVHLPITSLLDGLAPPHGLTALLPGALRSDD